MMSELVLYSHPAAAAVEKQLEVLSPQFAQVLGEIMSPARLIRTVMVSLDRTPKLFECDRQTIFMAAMSAACLGLEVDGVTGQAFILPFKGRAQLITGYKGYNTMAGRGGYVIRGAVVREGDAFEWDKANGALVHKPKIGAGDRRIIGAWALAASHTLPPVAEFIEIDELLALRSRAPGAGRAESPWNDPKVGFPAMCEKTAKRRLARSMPLNLMHSAPLLHKLHSAARLDEAVEEQGRPAWVDPQKGVIIDTETVESPLPPTQKMEPIIVDGDKATCEWPELPVALAKRVAAMMEHFRTLTTSALIENRWKNKNTRALLDEVRAASREDYDRIAEAYDAMRSELLLQEKERG